MCSIVAHENGFQLLFQKFGFGTDIVIYLYNGIRWIGPSDVMFSKHSSTYTGWRPVVAAYQWWPFAFCTRNYAFVATQIWPFCKR